MFVLMCGGIGFSQLLHILVAGKSVCLLPAWHGPWPGQLMMTTKTVNNNAQTAARLSGC